MTKNIAVIFGGRSTEHDVSIVTAISSIIKPLELIPGNKYKVIPVYISKQGIWYSDDKLKDISTFTSEDTDSILKKIKRLNLRFENGLSFIQTGLTGRRTKIDMVFPAMHGTFGEDGSLMGVLRMACVPFVGCDMEASVIAMDKVSAKLIAEASGILTPKMKYYTRNSYFDAPKHARAEIVKALKFPLFVKPSHLGSSIGITKVDSEKDLANAIEVALHYDDKVLIEEGVNNLIEVTLPIMGNEKPVTALLEQPMLADNGVFDFDTKYIRGGKGAKNGGGKTGEAAKGAQGYSTIPAKVSKDIYDTAVNTALDVYKAVGCQGYARIDMLIDSKTKKVYFNEINPMPGSLYAHNWKKSGVSNVELVEKLIGYAQERFEAQQKTNRVFETSFLKQF